ncbi:MAG: ABC transporter permease [Bryobacteraceae bacterium]
MTITPFLALVRKDLTLFFTDRRAVLVTLLAPILIGSFIGYTFGGGPKGTPEATHIPVLTVDLDGSTISREIVSQLAAEKALDVKPAALSDARAKVREGKAALAIVIPTNFGEDAARAFFMGTRRPELQVLYDPSRSTEHSMVQGMLTGYVMQTIMQESFGGQTGRSMMTEALAQVEQSQDIPKTERKALLDLLRSVRTWNERTAANGQANRAGSGSGLRTPYETREEAVMANQGAVYNGYAHCLPGMGIQFILFMGIDVGIGLLVTRQRGLWSRLRAAPLSRGVLLGSRAVSAAITAMLVMLTIFAFARVVFGIRIEGSVAGFLGICVAFSLMTATFGLLIAALGRTPATTHGLALVVTLLAVMLGGAWAPTFVFPLWLQRVTVFVPTRWAMDGFDAMTWRGLGFSAAAAPIVMLLLFALVCGLLAVARFRWEADT